ncbi:histone-lysine N-methyltransferase SETMAR [Trichonephila clavipes]|nr:histone-lysine N-methyltransferase SETMAR [Trichonephila clavipes]
MASQIPEEIHICHCILLEFHKGSNATVDTKNICDVYPSALDVRRCHKWFSKFRSGNFDLSDSHRSGRPTTLDNDVIKGASGSKFVSDNRGTVKCSYDVLNKIENKNIGLVRIWSFSTCSDTLTNLGRPSKNIFNRLVKQTEQVFGFRIICLKKKTELTDLRHTTLLQRYNTDRFLITANEKWVLYDNPKRKRQWLSPNIPPLRTAKPGLHPIKALLCVWWGIRGIVHFEVLKPGETVNADLYWEQLDRLNQSLIEKYPAIFNRKGVILQHDNARPQEKRWKKLMDWGGRYFTEKPIDFYRSDIENLHTKWQKVVANEGDYIID